MLGQERKLKAAPQEFGLLLLFCSYLHLPSLLLLFFILLVLHFSSGPSSSRESESVVRWYARGIVQLFLAGTLTVRYTGPAIESPPYVMWRWSRWRPNRPNLPLFPVRDQNTRFSKGGCVFHPFSSLLLDATLCGPDFPLRNYSTIYALRSTCNRFSWNRCAQFYTNIARARLRYLLATR